MSIFVNKVEIYAFQIATAATLSVIKNHNKREFALCTMYMLWYLPFETGQFLNETINF